MCGNVTGRYFPDSGEIEYKARFILILCLRHGLKGKRITPSQFEQEGGMGYSRKWKRSIKCQVGHGKRSMPLGKWMEQNNKFSDSRESVIEDVDEENETSESLQETKVLPRRKLLEQGLKSGSEKPVFYLKDGEMNVELPKVLKPVRNSKNKRVLDYSKMNSTEFRHEMIHDPDHILRLKLLEESYPLVSNVNLFRLANQILSEGFFEKGRAVHHWLQKNENQCRRGKLFTQKRESHRKRRA